MGDEKRYRFNDFDKWRSGDWAVAAVTYVLLTFGFHFSWWGDVGFAAIAGSVSSMYRLKAKHAAEAKVVNPPENDPAASYDPSSHTNTEGTNVCRSCGASGAPGAAFCFRCGSALASTPEPRPSAEICLPQSSRESLSRPNQSNFISAVASAPEPAGSEPSVEISLPQRASTSTARPDKSNLIGCYVLLGLLIALIAGVTYGPAALFLVIAVVLLIIGIARRRSVIATVRSVDARRLWNRRRILFAGAAGILALVIGFTVSSRSLPSSDHKTNASPKALSYDDVLTFDNAKTFASQNANWNSDNPNNVAYVQRAMNRLCLYPYGQTFGALMDNEESHEAASPKNVSYDDVLNSDDSDTFASHNADWNNDDPDNVAYVQRAIKRLGHNACGRKFGALMDDEKSYAGNQEQQRHLELAKQGKIDLGYDDVLTPQNAKTFEYHNNWNSDNPDNVAYVKRAIATEGSSAFGKTFGQLMDDVKPKQLLTGSTAVLSQDLRPCFTSKDDYEDSVHAAVINDRTRVEEDLENALTLESGTPITVVDMAIIDGITEVRAQGGNSYGTACWALTSSLQESVRNVSAP